MGHTYTSLHAHVVFSTKGRKPPLLTVDVQERVYEYIGGIIRGEKGVQIAIGGMPDHVHILLRLHPMTSMAAMVRLIKCNSSKWLRESHQPMRSFSWQEGYGAFAVSKSQLSQVEDYIRNQEAHHRTVSFEEEFVAFLDRHGLEYDRRFVMD